MKFSKINGIILDIKRNDYHLVLCFFIFCYKSIDFYSEFCYIIINISVCIYITM